MMCPACGSAMIQRNRWLLTLAGACCLLSGCGRDAPAPPAVEALTVSIDAGNNCSLEDQVVDCAAVASFIRARYPTSKPRVDICLEKETRFEAAAEVMKSVTDAGFTVGDLSCRIPSAG
jgi:biopolymer transport protein ExbD